MEKTAAKFLNVKGYTDVTCYRVFNIDERKGTAMAIEVERVFKPQFIPGGFAAVCINQEDQNTAPWADKRNATPFAITRNSKDIWGVKHDDVIYSWFCDAFKPEGIAAMMAKGNARIVKNAADGRDLIQICRLTKSGKIGQTFTQYGKLEDTCGAFYDYNF